MEHLFLSGWSCKRWILWAVVFSWIALLMAGCGPEREERERREGIWARGRENAVHYVEEKYGFTPKVEEVQVCTERGDGDPVPWANGYVLAFMSYGGETFKVHISGEGATLDGQDDRQYGLVLEDAKRYFEELLGYRVYDLYLSYQEARTDGSRPLDGHEDNLIQGLYSPGGLGDFLQKYPASIRIDDCMDQDLTELGTTNPAAAAFFEEYAGAYGMKAVLISYRDEEAYQNGLDHTYGRGGVLTYGIWKDGLGIRSYAAFDEEEMEAECFELQAFDGLLFGCTDQAEGADLQIAVSQEGWIDLGETEGEPLSKVYAVETDFSGPITVYLPVARYGKRPSVYIQYHQDGRWWQYEASVEDTKDGQYSIVTYMGIPEGDFTFAVFRQGPLPTGG